MPGEKYDTALAVLAYRMLYFETHPIAECYQRIWQPINKHLRALMRTKPRELVCLNSRVYTESVNEDPRQIDIHVVSRARRLLLLGTASTREAAVEDWWIQLSAIADVTGSPPAQLAWHGARALRRDMFGAVIPLNTEELTDKQLESAARRVLIRYYRLLEAPLIRWLDDNTALALYTHLYQKAERTARPLSEDKNRDIIRREYTP